VRLHREPWSQDRKNLFVWRGDFQFEVAVLVCCSRGATAIVGIERTGRPRNRTSRRVYNFALHEKRLRRFLGMGWQPRRESNPEEGSQGGEADRTSAPHGLTLYLARSDCRVRLFADKGHFAAASGHFFHGFDLICAGKERRVEMGDRGTEVGR